MADEYSARLEAHAEAARVHTRLGLDSTLLQRGETRIDVFDAAHQLGITVAFKPLKGLLGAYLKEEEPGMLISTLRPQSMQRFTGAHELGHHCLRHASNLDSEASLLHPDDPIEKQANHFASAFLLPPWLLRAVAIQKQIVRGDLLNPGVVYQLALRFGCSYVATAIAIANLLKLSAQQRAPLVKAKPQTIKLNELGAEGVPPSKADVWVLNERDDNMRIHAGPRDQFVLRLKERPSAGYRWDISEARRAGFDIVERTPAAAPAVGPENTVYGAQRERTFILQAPQAVRDLKSDDEDFLNTLEQYASVVGLRQQRPWDRNSEPASTFRLAYEPTYQPSGLLVQQRIPS
ncbi:Zn-dependent peptidase ImmA (M78 family)/predicted secreted protein [Paraburkholderia sp. HC6.4b]|uniref:ImmA/IrrE family metallo-endopeptidase n=1 Tax=unclassified Paraburkholderia TaxID=2615204 RepID=UPI00160B34EC|nr:MULTISPECIES: ImmA/IrrE family metallo-endopeptidase [unclassified Paraburkholderia]MBB5411034.1 Zn-dependent peptidase ImmA (M78 family)/predicted secreted protein [Paraburkholderia sp. HC6.4b]MBB5455150.1 Zn-dependent peptidase ImmA (M78 family)/predicted secreted protein [Paraburkholderia sp. Kb1A]